MKKKIIDVLVSLISVIPDFILRLLEKFFLLSKYIVFSSRKKKNFKSTIFLQNKKIILNLKKNDHQAHDVYQALHKKKNIVYELPLIRFIIEVFGQHNYNNFLDLGSFMGYYACVVGKIFEEKKINIYAIESNPEYCQIIKKNIFENNLGNVQLINSALSDKNEELYVDNENMLLETKKKGLQKIKSNTLDEICISKDINPEIIKFDVHGFEGKVLDGLLENLKTKIKIIILELHSNSYLKKFSDSNKKEIINKLIRNEFNCYIVPYYGLLNLYNVTSNDKLESHKIPFRLIHEKNYEDLFFDKENNDNLILCFKKDVKIENFKCFYNLDKKN